MLAVGIIKDEHIVVSHLYKSHPLGASQQMIDQLVRSALIGSARGARLEDGMKPPVIRLTRSMSVVRQPLSDLLLYGVISGNEDVVASQSLLRRVGMVLGSVVSEHPEDMVYVLKHCLEAIVDFGCPQTTDLDQLRNSLDSLPAKPYRKNELFVDVVESLEVELATSTITSKKSAALEAAARDAAPSRDVVPIVPSVVAGQTTGKVTSSARLNLTSLCQMRWHTHRPLKWLGHPDQVVPIDGSEVTFVPTKDAVDVLTYVIDMDPVDMDPVDMDPVGMDPVGMDPVGMDHTLNDEVVDEADILDRDSPSCGRMHLPFLLQLTTLELRGVTITLELRIISNYTKVVQCNDAKLYFPLPLNTSNVNVKEGKAVYEQLQNRICWNIGRMNGSNAENRLRAMITTYKPITAFHGTAHLSFSLANKASVKITQLRLQNELFPAPPILWVKYQTNGRYNLRFQHTSTL